MNRDRLASLTRLTDADLRDQVILAASDERRATADLVALLAEFDRRRVYLAEGHSSLFAFCTDTLHLSESAAYTRIQAARAARAFPQILDVLRTGSVTLTSIGLLAPHLTNENCNALLLEVRHKRKRDVELIVARLRPQPDVPSVIRKLPTPSVRVTTAQVATPSVPLPPTKPAVIAPLTPERYKLQITVDREAHDLLRQAQDLMRHAVPNGDPALIVTRALRLLVDDLLRKKAAAVARPRPSREATDGSRAIPASVRRAVWSRDRGRCAFEGSRGRCGARGPVEYHHVIPYAIGGTATVDNIELRCRAHNAHEARLKGLDRPEEEVFA